VCVGFNVVGHVIVDHQCHIRHIDTTTSNISGNEHVVGVVLEAFDRDLRRATNIQRQQKRRQQQQQKTSKWSSESDDTS
jgi:hypothetical protein